MGNFTFKKVLLIMALAILPITSFAQDENNVQRPKNNNHWFIDGDFGGAFLVGDNKVSIKDINFNGRFGFGYAFAKHWSAYAKFGSGYLSGALPGLFTTNYGNYISINANISLDLISLIGGYRENRVFGLKLHAGVGQLHYKAKVTTADNAILFYGYGFSKDIYSGKGFDGRKLALEIPMGLEFNFRITKTIDLYADITATLTDVDILDGFKHNKHNDWYSTGNIGIRVKFGKCTKKAKTAEPKEEIVAPKEEAVAPKEEAPKVEQVVETPKEPVKVVETPKPVYFDKSINLEYEINTAEINIEKGEKSIADFKNNMGDVRIEKIVINGYASPEGEGGLNERLSLDRAEAAKSFIMEKLGDKVKNVKFEVNGKGADWNGFLKALGESNINDKEAIAKKINEASDKAGALWLMSQKYPEIRNLHPALRRADVIVTVVK